MPTTQQKAEIEVLLQKPQWLLPIPVYLKESYHRQRVQEFQRLAALGSPLLLLMFAGLIAFLYFFYGDGLSAHDRALATRGESFCMFLLTGGILAARWEKTKSTFNFWIPPILALILCNKILIGSFVQGPDIALNYVYVTLLVVIVGVLALQLTTLAAVMGCLLALPAFLPGLLTPEKSDFTFYSLSYYFLAVMVCLFVAAVREDKDRVTFLQSVLLDMEKEEVGRLNGELTRLAQQDALTGLANRRHFDNTMDREWERARRQQTAVSVILIDVDHFKAYNDHYGHLAGDEALVRVAEQIGLSTRRPGDLAARYGGEEFVLLLPDTYADGAEDVAQRLLAAVDALGIPHAASPTTGHVTLSMGLATGLPDSTQGWNQLIDQADNALYQAKAGGRHRYVCHAGTEEKTA